MGTRPTTHRVLIRVSRRRPRERGERKSEGKGDAPNGHGYCTTGWVMWYGGFMESSGEGSHEVGFERPGGT